MAAKAKLFDHVAGQVSDADERIAAKGARRLFDPVDIAGAGHTVAVAWEPVVGATKAEVTSASLTLSPAVAEEVHDDVGLQSTKEHEWDIDVPEGRRVRAIALDGFKQPGGGVISEAPGGQRISVAFPKPQGGGFDSPRFAVPAIGRQGAVPRTLTGATFSHGVLKLTPSVKAGKVRIALVTGDNPSAFAAQPTELTSVQLTTHTAARNAKVTGPDGAVVWQVLEFDPDADSVEVDLRQALEAAFNAQLRNGEVLQAQFTVRADAPAEAVVDFNAAGGALVRTEEGILQSVLAGDPMPLALGAALATEAPQSAAGDLTIHYEGIRILETVSDPLPATGTPVSGIIAATQGAVRALPPAALEGHEPARVGVFGRAPEACELAIEFVEIHGDTIGAVLMPPAVIRLEPDTVLRTCWAEFRPGVRLPGAVGVRVRANTGRFFWAGTSAGQPLVRIAIRDPDPGGRALYLGDSKLVDVRQEKSHQPGFSFAPAALLRGQAPVLHSDLFLTVEISDLTLKYAR